MERISCSDKIFYFIVSSKSLQAFSVAFYHTMLKSTLAKDVWDPEACLKAIIYLYAELDIVIWY